MDEEFEFAVSLPLDADGFLRRECPNCEREFKWLPSTDSDLVPEEGYCCPYCGQRASDDAWLTRGQRRVVEAAVDENVILPQLRQLQDSLAGLGAASGGLLEVKVEHDKPLRPGRLTEPNDMKRIVFECHPREPVKVLEEWTETVHCLICGRAMEL